VIYHFLLVFDEWYGGTEEALSMIDRSSFPPSAQLRANNSNRSQKQTTDSQHQMARLLFDCEHFSMMMVRYRHPDSSQTK